MKGDRSHWDRAVEFWADAFHSLRSYVDSIYQVWDRHLLGERAWNRVIVPYAADSPRSRDRRRGTYTSWVSQR
jgi:hypothetical protein